MTAPDKAIEFIIKNASAYAQAKADRVLLEEFRKSKKALLMKDALARGYEAVNAQEREAYSNKEYIDLLHGIKEAVHREEELRWMIEAARMRVDVWRTESANQRLQGAVTL